MSDNFSENDENTKSVVLLVLLLKAKVFGGGKQVKICAPSVMTNLDVILYEL